MFLGTSRVTFDYIITQDVQEYQVYLVIESFLVSLMLCILTGDGLLVMSLIVYSYWIICDLRCIDGLDILWESDVLWRDRYRIDVLDVISISNRHQGIDTVILLCIVYLLKRKKNAVGIDYHTVGWVRSRHQVDVRPVVASCVWDFMSSGGVSTRYCSGSSRRVLVTLQAWQRFRFSLDLTSILNRVLFIRAWVVQQ